MKKSVFYSLTGILLLLFLNYNQGYAQQKKVIAKNFIIKTNLILRHAREVVKMNKVYTGDLNKASCHQKLAHQLFKEGRFKTAVFHSQRARTLAFQSIKANKSKVKPEMEPTAAEQDLIKDIPIAAQLDAEITIPEGSNDETAAAEKDVDVN